MKKLLVLCITLVSIISCSKDENTLSEVNIRLSNVSQYDFQNIVINTSTGNVNFENLASGQKSDYKGFDKAYHYAFVQLDVDGKTYTLQPIDYVGEMLLNKGNYTYQLDINDTDNQYNAISLTFIED